MTMRWLPTLLALAALGACGRPLEVRSLASAALPIATNIKTAAESQQSRFAVQRDLLDGRANELAQQAALARNASYQIEQDWKFQGNAALPKTLAMFREGDAAILADPLAPVSPPTTISSKPAALDTSSLNKVVTGFDRLRAARQADASELFGFFVSVNEKLVEIEQEKKADPK
jgi:hypothetical protein